MTKIIEPSLTCDECHKMWGVVGMDSKTMMSDEKYIRARCHECANEALIKQIEWEKLIRAT